MSLKLGEVTTMSVVDLFALSLVVFAAGYLVGLTIGYRRKDEDKYE